MKAIPHVIKKDHIQVTMPGKGPFMLHSSHPTFNKLKSALKSKRWAKVPKLVSLAASIHDCAIGDVNFTGGVFSYKGVQVDVSLTNRIVEMINENKDVKHMMLFMNNLYKNPSQEAIKSFFDWLVDNNLPITDDGCFLAYKSVDDNYLDTYSKTVSNKPGQVIMMSRKVVNTDYHQQCSTGYHICSKQYGIYGSKVLAVKTNPIYVLSAVGGKMRVSQYEVLMELGTKRIDIDEGTFQAKGFDQLERKLVIETKKEKKEMLSKLLKVPDIKRKLRSRKLKKTTLFKISYARLKELVQKYGIVKPDTITIGPEHKLFLQAARKAAGLSVGQVAKKMKLTYKVVATLEKKEEPNQSSVENYLLALGELTGNKNISFPKPVNA